VSVGPAILNRSNGCSIAGIRRCSREASIAGTLAHDRTTPGGVDTPGLWRCSK
jgi:hypothetical protein